MSHPPFHYSIDPLVFERFPGYCRGVVLAFGVINHPSPPELVELLRQEESSLRQRLEPGGLGTHPRLVSWREAYRSFGAKPGKFRASMEAMARRVLAGDSLPSIGSLVDIGNIISLRHLLPAGGHAIDVLRGDIRLRLAEGDEQFIPFGSDVPENPDPGEVIFTEGKTVLTRRWTWRQANHTLLLPSTREVEFNVDGLPPLTREDIGLVCRETAELVTRFCGGRTSIGFLTADHPGLELAISG